MDPATAPALEVDESIHTMICTYRSTARLFYRGGRDEHPRARSDRRPPGRTRGEDSSPETGLHAKTVVIHGECEYLSADWPSKSKMVLCPRCSTLTVSSIIENHTIHPDWSSLEHALEQYDCEFCHRIYDTFLPLMLKSLPGLAVDQSRLRDWMSSDGTLKTLPDNWYVHTSSAIGFRTVRSSLERVTQKDQHDVESVIDDDRQYVLVGLNYDDGYPQPANTTQKCQNASGMTLIRLICGPPEGLENRPTVARFDTGVQYDKKTTAGLFHLFEFGISMDVCAHKDDPILSYLNIAAANIFDDREDEEVDQQIKHWRDECKHHHAECETLVSDEKAMPRRLAKIDQAHSTGLVTVIEVDEAFTQHYAVLSYCWGTHLDAWIRLILATQRERKPYLFRSMPQTIQDAVSLASRLGYRYLWVDCLCITQQDPDDWASESEKMGTIFETADLVISATATADCHQGFLEVQKQRHAPRLRLPIVCGPNQVGNLVFGPRPGKFWLYDCPVPYRAWCMQERLLGRRILHCLPQEFFFECARCRRYEREIAKCFHFDVPLEADQRRKCGKPIGNAQDMRTWNDIVQDYCERNLTASSDKLVAISALARRMSIISGGRYGTYLAGIWSEGLLRYLLWSAHGRTGSKKQKAWRAPSWSWASMDTPIEWSQPLSDTNYTSHVDILHASTVTAPSRPFGAVQSAKITLRGLVKSAPTTMMMGFWEWLDQVGFGDDDPDDVYGWYRFDDDASYLRPRTEIICLKLLTTIKTRSTQPGLTFALILEKVGEGEEYARIGLGRIFDLSIFDAEVERELGLV